MPSGRGGFPPFFLFFHCQTCTFQLLLLILYYYNNFMPNRNLAHFSCHLAKHHPPSGPSCWWGFAGRGDPGRERGYPGGRGRVGAAVPAQQEQSALPQPRCGRVVQHHEQNGFGHLLSAAAPSPEAVLALGLSPAGDFIPVAGGGRAQSIAGSVATNRSLPLPGLQ